MILGVSPPKPQTLLAFLGHFDFIYALPSMWLSVPFTFLGSSNHLCLPCETLTLDS